MSVHLSGYLIPASSIAAGIYLALCGCRLQTVTPAWGGVVMDRNDHRGGVWISILAMTVIFLFAIWFTMKTIVITSGYFNPLHPWHIECFELCKALWDELRVIINTDEQIKIKTQKDTVFQDEQFRMKLVSALKSVDRVMLSVDKDESVCESIKHIANIIRQEYGTGTKIIFGKWGDRFASNIPEVQVCKDCDIEIRDGLGAKTHNSSDYRANIV